MTIRSALTALLAAFCIPILAAAQELTVLTAKGAVNVKRGNSIQALSAGATLRGKDMVVAQAPCYVVFTAAGGKTLEVKSSLTASAADLFKTLQSQKGSGMSGKIASYIFNELKQSVPNVKEYQQSMVASAAVDRTAQTRKKDAGNELFGISTGQTSSTGESTSKTTANEGIAKTAVESALGSLGLGGLFGNAAGKAAAEGTRPPRVWLVYPHSTYILDSTVQFYWACEKPAQTFVFRLVNPAGGVVAEKELQDSTLELNIRALSPDRTQCYRWSVQVKDSPELTPAEECISLLDAEREAAVRDSVMALRQELGVRDASGREATTTLTALGFAASAVLYERNRLAVSAFQAYREVAHRAPDVEEYNIALLKLIKQWGLDYEFVRQRLLKSSEKERSKK